MNRLKLIELSQMRHDLSVKKNYLKKKQTHEFHVCDNKTLFFSVRINIEFLKCVLNKRKMMRWQNGKELGS